MDLAKWVLKNNIFEHNLSLFEQLWETTIGTKMAPLCAIIFMRDLEERILKDWWRYTDIFLLWQHEEEKLKEFLDIPSIKFTSKYSREGIDF